MEHSVYIPAERQKKMIEYIEANTSAQIHELAEKFHVSEATVRRDLDDLDRQGALRRTHGGAIKDTVLIDSGTTAFFIAQALSRHEGLTLITNDLYIAYQTPLHPSSTLIVTGGTRRQGRQELIGTMPEDFIRSTHVDVAFIGADGISVTGGVTNANFEEIGVKKLMLRAAERSVIAADHTKFGRVALARICDLREVDALLTDDGLEPEMAAKIRKACPALEVV